MFGSAMTFSKSSAILDTLVSLGPFRASLVQLLILGLVAWASFGTTQRCAGCHRNTVVGSFLRFGSGSRSWESSQEPASVDFLLILDHGNHCVSRLAYD